MSVNNKSNDRAYDTFSAHYDKFVNWHSRLEYEIPLIKQILMQVKDKTGNAIRVLDAACGTGMHAIALAKDGYHVVGADLSQGMVEKAGLNAATENADIRFVAAGFGKLAPAFRNDPLFPFDVVLCLGNSLPHLLTKQALSDALLDFNACLRPGGVLLIQNRNFDAVLAERTRWMEPQAYSDGTQEWLFIRFYDFEADGLINFNILTLERNQGEPWQQQIISTQLNPLRQIELSEALSAAGFTEISSYGSMAGEPFDPLSSANLVLVARTG